MRRGLLGLALAAGLLGLSGCGTTEGPDLTEILPLNWATVGETGFRLLPSAAQWRQINIDGDVEPEFLLLYTYGVKNMYVPDGELDVSAAESEPGAPMGAVIYNGLESAEFVVGSPVVATPLQPAATYIPYRVAPSYWPSPNTGYVGKYSDRGEITHAQYTTDETGMCAGAEDGLHELVISDGGNTLTFAWWRNPYEGFGATQLMAPGGFRNATTGGPTTEIDLRDIGAPIWSIDAFYPLAAPQNLEDGRVVGGFADPQRSMQCRVFRYYREQATNVQSDDYRIDVNYVDDDLGIQFCRAGGDADPFFPEAVALRFLLDSESRMNLLDSGLDQQTKERIVRTVLFLDLERERDVESCNNRSGSEKLTLSRFRVNALETRAVVPYLDQYRRSLPENLDAVPRSLSFVCAELTTIEPGAPLAPPEDPELQALVELDGDIDRTRLLFFSLEHEAPSARDINGTTVHFTDRFYIVDLEDASDWGHNDCKSLLAADAHEPRGGAQ